jgi:hypothetical protein
VLDYDTGEEAEDQAAEARVTLRDLGVPESSIGVEFSGRKGYHVWVVLKDYVPNAELRRLGRAALVLAGHPSATEVFPKQDEVRDLGNLVKLPGGIHQVSGKPNNFIGGGAPMPMLAPQWAAVVAALPEEVRATYSGPVDNRFPCLGEIQCGVQEGGRNRALFQAATMFRRHGAQDGLVRAILEHINELGDPVDDAELESIVRSSANSGPICEPEMREKCGDLCIKARLSGLNTRPGQVRGASVGESVVVTLASREDDKVMFEHDDLELAKGLLRQVTK